MVCSFNTDDVFLGTSYSANEIILIFYFLSDNYNNDDWSIRLAVSVS